MQEERNWAINQTHVFVIVRVAMRGCPSTGKHDALISPYERGSV